MTFDAYVAIDWSGAEGAYDGISIAVASPGAGAPRLVKPKARRWTRTEAAAWLVREMASRRLLVGCDFAFSLAYEPGLGYLGGRIPHAQDVFGLWDAVEEANRAATDFGCAGIVADPRYASLFWKSGTRPKDWTLRQRRAETACGAATGTWPETPYKFIGAKQVGKASLTGMRVVRHVRAQLAGRVSVWPFEAPAGSTLVEIYPTLFRKEAAGTNAKLRAVDALNAALRKLGARDVQADDFSDHDTDALISAAGLRAYMQRGWELPAVDDQVRREGWIFGVPYSPVEALAA